MGAIISVVTAFIIGATTWSFGRVAALPETYVNKDEHTSVHERIDEKLDKIYDKLIELGGR